MLACDAKVYLSREDVRVMGTSCAKTLKRLHKDLPVSLERMEEILGMRRLDGRYRGFAIDGGYVELNTPYQAIIIYYRRP